ncbi:udp-glucose 4-epimerase [Holotrichia oblita]|uniref:Udp-glucose 4-epimerase n=1 Tax=Holotrichia oblita TaxID=644536 RepID=A0ACB9TRA2_HOLOL|nr:udp-glucose 4-epimerase [Holotrichia oblita]
MKSSGVKNIIVLDESGFVAGELKSDKSMSFTVGDRPLDELRAEYSGKNEGDIFGILVIGSDIMTNPRNVQLYTFKPSTLETETAIAGQIGNIVEAEKLKAYSIENLPQIMEEVKTTVSVQAYRIGESGESRESSSTVSMIFAIAFGMMIYMMVFLYGGTVLQGVVEEKSSRVLEVVVSSVRPFDLMMGKILGIAAVALTQFFIWVVLIAVLGGLLMQAFAGDLMAGAASMTGEAGSMTAAMSGVDAESLAAVKTLTDAGFLLKMLGGFLVYFIGGYLLYAAMYAAIGSAVESSADAQQLQFPITIPIIMAMIIMLRAANDPMSPLAVWASIIPFTSPLVMMARLPYGVPATELVLSVVLLYLTFILTVWFAAKIYRVGIFITILVTGGAGYIGSHTAVELVGTGYGVVIADDLSNADMSAVEGVRAISGKDIPFVKADCCDEKEMEEIFREYGIDAVIHFAASKSVEESVREPLKYYRNNILSFATVLGLMRTYGVEHMVFSSSATVYGQPDALPVTESAPRKPANSPYGNTKQICEDILRDSISAYDGMKGVALRYFNPIGAHPSALIGELPRGVPANLVPFITQTAAGIRERLHIFGGDYSTPDGTALRDYIDIMDLAKAHVAALDRMLNGKNKGRYEVFNIGTGVPLSVLRLVRTFERVNGVAVPYKITGRRAGDVEAVWADTSLANIELGWKASRSIEDSLASAWDWEKHLRYG